jgi:hypothetical protein
MGLNLDVITGDNLFSAPEIPTVFTPEGSGEATQQQQEATEEEVSIFEGAWG